MTQQGNEDEFIQIFPQEETLEKKPLGVLKLFTNLLWIIATAATAGIAIGYAIYNLLLFVNYFAGFLTLN